MYHLFAYEDYYPKGGFNDYVGSFATVEDAVQAFRKDPRNFDNGEIVQVIDGGCLKKTHNLAMDRKEKGACFLIPAGRPIAEPNAPFSSNPEDYVGRKVYSAYGHVQTIQDIHIHKTRDGKAILYVRFAGFPVHLRADECRWYDEITHIAAVQHAF